MSKDNESAAPNVDPNMLKGNEVARAVMGTGIKMDGFRSEFRDGAVELVGTVHSEEDHKRVLEAARTVTGISSVKDSLKVGAAAPGSSSAAGAAGGRSHTVKAGETLSGIAESYYGKASEHKRIFEANRNQLTDPDKIKVGQVLVIPE